MSDERATIAALASGAGRAGVAVIRVSGPRAWEAVAALLKDSRLPEPRSAALRVLHHPASGAVLDEALIILFEEQRSFTGEAVAEIQCHGSPLIVEEILDCLEGLPGLRAAKAGEFSRRALLNGKMSILEVEALGALLEAQTPWQKELASRARVTGQEAMVRGWRRRMLTILADVEASIDFADEDLSELDAQPWQAPLADLVAELQDCLKASHWLEQHRSGLLCVIAGPPNVGKSSLINNLVGRSVALVHDSEGTTRDAIEASMVVAGVPLTLVDTAGLRRDVGAVETMGVERALALWQQADIRVCTRRPGQEVLDDAHVVVQTFAESQLAPPGRREAEQSAVARGLAPLIQIDNKSGMGLTELRAELERLVLARLQSQGLQQALTSQRQNRLAQECLEALAGIMSDTAIELQALHLTQGINALSLLLGDYDVEEMLDALFENFCIGK